MISDNDFLLSIDDCDGTGDHENYFKETTSAYELDGTYYTDCTKRAVSYRSKNEHRMLSTLTDYSILFSDGNSYYDLNIINEKNRNKKIFNPDFS